MQRTAAKALGARDGCGGADHSPGDTVVLEMRYALVLLVGCYRPDPYSCRIACASDGLCPSGLSCGPANLCVAKGDSCSASVVDASEIDAPEPDASSQPLCPTGKVLACWPMDGDGLDHSGNDNHVTMSTVDFVPGKKGMAASFDANERMTVTIAGGSSISLTATGGTVEVWLRPSAFPTTDTMMRAGVLDNNSAYSMFLTDTGAIRCSGGNGHIGGQLVVGTWTHAACVWGSGMVSVFVNGNLAVMGPGTPGDEGDGSVDIGSDAPFAADDGQYEGEIDHLIIWGEPRSRAQLCESAGIECL